MSKEYQGENPLDIAKRAEQDLAAQEFKEGHRIDGPRPPKGGSDSLNESGVDESVQQRFPGAEVKHGSEATGAGDNRKIPLDEGGDVNPVTGQLHKAGEFEGVGGPEDKARMQAENNPGSDEVRENIRPYKQ